MKAVFITDNEIRLIDSLTSVIRKPVPKHLCPTLYKTSTYEGDVRLKVMADDLMLRLNDRESFKVGDAKSILDSVQQVQISNLYDKSLLKKSARKANSIQQLLIYQLIINIIPYSIRRLIKVIKYKNSSDGESKLPNYVKYINDL